MIETFTVMCWSIITFIHTTNSLHKPQHHQQQPPTNIEEDDILSFVEADNTHISSGSPMKPFYRKTSPTMFCVSLKEINVYI